MIKKKLHFYSYILLCGTLLIAFSIFSFMSIYNNYANLGIWDATKDIFALLGILLAIGAAIPVISGVFSYQQFNKSVKESKRDLLVVKSQLKKLSKQIENYEASLNSSLEKVSLQETVLEEYIALAKHNKIIRDFVLNENVVNDPFDVEISLNKINSILLYQNIALEKLNEHYLFQEVYRYGDNGLTPHQLEKFIQIRAKLVENYNKLSNLDTTVIRKYVELLCGTINYLAKQNIDKQNEKLLTRLQFFKEKIESIDTTRRLSFSEMALITQAHENLKMWFPPISA